LSTKTGEDQTTASSRNEDTSSTRPFRVGVYLPSSGPEAAFGGDTRNGIDLAVSRVVDSGGIRGRSLEVVYVNDHSRAKDASDTVLQFSKDPSIIAILGEVSSARSKAGGIVANKLGVPMLTPAATNPDVTTVGPFVFRSCYDDAAQGSVAARYLVQERKRKKLGVLWASDDLASALLARTFREEAQRLGATVFERKFPSKETDFKDELAEFRKERIEIIYVPLYYTAIPPVARDAKSLGFSGREFFGSDGWTSETLFQEAGAVLTGAEFTTQWLSDDPSTENRAFVEAYRGRFHRDPSNLSALGYNAAALIADAIQRAESDNRKAVRDALADTRGFQGVMGKITMGKDRNPETDVVIARVDGGRFRFHTRVRSVPAP